MPGFPRITIRHDGDNIPSARFATIELDGKPLTTVTALNLKMSVDGLTEVTLTFLANVDADILAADVNAVTKVTR